MSMNWLFATPIYKAPLLKSRAANQQFRDSLREAALDVKKYDRDGAKWSKANYPHGFTSYSSWDNLHQRISAFADLKLQLQTHVAAFIRQLQWDARPQDFQLRQLWVNYMGKGAFHSWHLHPLSVISGTYYIDAEGLAPIQFEDPRISMKMGCPISKKRSKFQVHQPIFPTSGSVVLFESWLKHSVPPNTSTHPRISVSFNFDWIRY